MFWRKSTIYALDCIAVAAGLAIATPFVLILTSPFIAGFGPYHCRCAGGHGPPRQSAAPDKQWRGP